MSDFYKAIQVGIKSARSAEVANKEIDAVFSELNESVLQSTEGRVAVRLDEDSVSKAFIALKRVSKVDAFFNVRLVSSNDPTKHYSIATVSRAATGYPVQLVHNLTTMTVNDAPGLRSALSNVLATPDVGRSILELANAPRLADSSATATKKPTLRRPG